MLTSASKRRRFIKKKKKKGPASLLQSSSSLFSLIPSKIFTPKSNSRATTSAWTHTTTLDIAQPRHSSNSGDHQSATAPPCSHSTTKMMSPNKDEGVWSGDSKDEQVWSSPSNKTHAENNITGVGEDATEKYEDRVEEPKEGMVFNTSEEAYLHYSRYAKEKGFAVAKKTSRKGKDGKLKDVTLECCRAGKAKVKTSNPIKPRPQSKIGCPAHITVVIHADGKWRLNRVILEHNHDQSPGKARYLKSNRVLNEQVKRTLELHDKAGIRLHKSFDSLQIEAGGPGKTPFIQKDARNHVDSVRRKLLVEGDAKAMNTYFMKMKADNDDFFFALDLDDEGRLRNVFWADARSRAACKEFGDVVTFDTTYLVNRYDMSFAPFVGVNHHGQSILLACGLISHEDTKSFEWLFQTWKTCMWGCAPKAIITDQCMAMKNAIENIFPDTRHRWCIWHVMKKVPEKLSSYSAYENMSWCMRRAVYASLSIKEFEDAWDVFIKKYDLQSNTWLEGLYLERKRWVPAYLNDMFWAGMSSTQRSERMNAYFDGYVHSKTTLKQFVEQYENALANKVENESLEDVKSWNTYIPLITEDELEKQFQKIYTNAKVKEFQEQFVGRLSCICVQLPKVGHIVSEYEINEWVIFGEGEEKKRILVPFMVNFNAETNEAHCNCQLFESRGMVCKHQLFVWHQRGIERVPDRYILKRWCKNIKRVHTKVRICYDKSSTSIEARRHDNMCNLFNEVADLAEESSEKYDMVMARVRELKRELMEASVVCESNSIALGDDTDTCHVSFSLGDGVITPKQSTNILDPEGLRRKGRPPCKRKVGVVEKAVKKKIQTHKKPLSKEKSEEVEEIVIGHHIGTQESVVNIHGHPSYVGHSMWPNMMPHSMQGRSIFPFSPTGASLCPSLLPTGASLSPSLLPAFISSQSLLNDQGWMGQSTIVGSQVWGGGQPNNLEGEGQYWGGPQPNILKTQGQICEGQPCFTEMLNASDD